MIKIISETWYTIRVAGKLRLLRVKQHTGSMRCVRKTKSTVMYLSDTDPDRSTERVHECKDWVTEPYIRVSSFYGNNLETFAFCHKHGGIVQAELALVTWLEGREPRLITAKQARRLSKHRRRSTVRQYCNIKFED